MLIQIQISPTSQLQWNKKNKVSHSLSCKHRITLLKLWKNMTYEKRKEKKNRSIYLGYQTFRDPSFQAKNGSKIQLIYLSPLTFHFHDLVGVLNHLIFGFVAEGMSPGLNQVQNLVSDIWFRLFLVIKDWEWIFTPLTPSFIYNLEFCNHITLVQQSISNTSWIKQLKEKKKKLLSQGYDIIRK